MIYLLAFVVNFDHNRKVDCKRKTENITLKITYLAWKKSGIDLEFETQILADTLIDYIEI